MKILAKHGALSNFINQLTWKLTHLTIETIRILLVFAIFCFFAEWAIDYFSGIIVPFDSAAYPICLLCLMLILAVSFAHWFKDSTIYLAVYVIIAGYIIGTSLYHHMISRHDDSNVTQWLGLNYVMAYLFLDVRRAGPTILCVYITTILGHYLVLSQEFSLDDTLGIVFNMAMAHLVYIALLWTVVRMRINHAQITTKMQLLEQYAHVDPLTKLLNRRGLSRALAQLHQAYHVRNLQFSILMLDIDHFKTINDRYGHLVGDKVLTEIAHLLETIVRQGNDSLIARWGGEEFVVAIQNNREQDRLAVAERIRSTIEHHHFPEVPSVTVSIGICHCLEAGTTDDMLTIADKNLYRVKQSGRNQVMTTPKFA